jgi:hypothetical protein
MDARIGGVEKQCTSFVLLASDFVTAWKVTEKIRVSDRSENKT